MEQSDWLEFKTMLQLYTTVICEFFFVATNFGYAKVEIFYAKIIYQ